MPAAAPGQIHILDQEKKPLIKISGVFFYPLKHFSFV